jgi:hypothetical protein
MEPAPFTPWLPADYYRKHAARVRGLVADATTLAIKAHLLEVARQYDGLAEGAEEAARIGNAPPKQSGLQTGG